MKKIFLIINPKSGKTKSKTTLYNMIDEFDRRDILVTVRFTRHSGHASHLAKEASLSGEYDAIVCCGGDGTLNETVNGIMSGDNKVPVGYIPAGSTNDFASSMGIGSDILSAAESCAKGDGYPLDVGSFGEKNFCYIASFGAFTSTSYNTPQSFKNVFGQMAYVLEGIKDITAIQPYHIRAVTETENFEDDYIFGAVCNSTSVAGIVKINSEHVDMNDGLFEVILVKKPKNIIELNSIVRSCLTSDFSGKMFDFFKARVIDFSMPEEISWSLDGERVDGGLDIHIENIHDAILFIR